MSRLSIAIAAGAFFVLTLAALALAADDPFVGTWKLNVGKSKFTGPAPKSLTLRIKPAGKGLDFERDRVGADGKETHDSRTVELDGKDHPSPGAGETQSSTRTNANSITWVVKAGGKQVQLWKFVVARNGETMTANIDTTDAKGQDSHATAVYERERK